MVLHSYPIATSPLPTPASPTHHPSPYPPPSHSPGDTGRATLASSDPAARGAGSPRAAVAALTASASHRGATTHGARGGCGGGMDGPAGGGGGGGSEAGCHGAAGRKEGRGHPWFADGGASPHHARRAARTCAPVAVSPNQRLRPVGSGRVAPGRAAASASAARDRVASTATACTSSSAALADELGAGDTWRERQHGSRCGPPPTLLRLGAGGLELLPEECCRRVPC